MKRHVDRKLVTAAAIVAGAAAIGAGAAIAAGGDHEGEAPITGPARAQASAAAVAQVGGGRVTGTEVGDEESLYEVEVTRADGSQVDVQLDDAFRVVGSEREGRGDGED